MQLPGCVLAPVLLKGREAASSGSTPVMYGCTGSHGCMVS